MNDLLTQTLLCKKWIDDALAYSGGTHEFAHVLQCILNGTMQLWPSEKGCIVTEIVTYPQKRVLHIFLAGGELDQILDMEESLIHFGKANGCTSLTLAGRKGWVRTLKNRNWEEQFAVVGKEI